MILWSIHTFWYKGLAANKIKYDKFEKGNLFLKNNSPALKADFHKNVTKIIEFDNSQTDCK